jgi:hypothetical protein
MTEPLRMAEYGTLRTTISQRGSVRFCLILVGLIAWGGLTLALNAAEFERAVTLVPLIVLAATFELSFFIHTGVERVGRYLQVFHEDVDGWEHTIMNYGRNNSGGLDPLFITLFALVAVVDFFGSFPAAARHVGWLVISIVAHLVLGWRLITARRLAAGQRALDLDRFLALKNTPVSK